MSFINKFGESSIKKNNLKLRTCEHNLQINKIIKDIENINNTFKSVKDVDLMFSNKTEKRLIAIEDHIFERAEEYKTELNIIRNDLNSLEKSITNDINNDVRTIQKAVNDQIDFRNKDFIKNIEERFNKIEDFIFKSLENKGAPDVVKKRKIEWPKIKVAK